MKIWLDTDIGPDCDDTGALGLLLEMQHRGQCELVCATHCTSNPWGLPVIELLNDIDGTKIPVGTLKAPGFLPDGSSQKYTKPLMQTYGMTNPCHEEQPDAMEVVRELLRGAKNKEITLVAIGPLINIENCLKDEEICSLMHQKLKKIWIMGCLFEFEPRFAEWNVEMAICAAKTLFETYQGDVCISPFEVGFPLMTGSGLKQFEGHPVEMSYRIFNDGTYPRPSWDLTAVYAAVQGTQDVADMSPRGRVEITDAGLSIFTKSENGNARYLRHPSPDWVQKMDALLEAYCRRTMAAAMARR